MPGNKIKEINNELEKYQKEIVETLEKGGEIRIKKNKESYSIYQNLIKKIK
jgi:hypothetical protein